MRLEFWHVTIFFFISHTHTPTHTPHTHTLHWHTTSQLNVNLFYWSIDEWDGRTQAKIIKYFHVGTEAGVTSHSMSYIYYLLPIDYVFAAKNKYFPGSSIRNNIPLALLRTLSTIFILSKKRSKQKLQIKCFMCMTWNVVPSQRNFFPTEFT